jgi:hypothetical protein
MKKKNYGWKKFNIFFYQKLQFFFKHVQTTGETFSAQKRTASTSKRETFKLFLIDGHFFPLGSGSGSGSSDLIEAGSDQDLKHSSFYDVGTGTRSFVY